MFHDSLLDQFLVVARRDSNQVGEFARRLPACINQAGNHFAASRDGSIVRQLRFDMDRGRCGLAVQTRLCQVSGNKYPVRRNVQTIRHVQPNMAVNAAALVIPSLETSRIQSYGQDVLTAKTCCLADVVASRRVAALVPAKFPAIEIDHAVAIHTIEFNPDAIGRR